MKRIYSRFRIALMAFALGLAAVYMTNGLSLAWGEVPVDLPKTKSTDVFVVFPIEAKYTEFDSIPRSRGTWPRINRPIRFRR